MANAQKQIVLLNGPPGSGKDTAASHLVPYFQFQKMKFAAPIKRMVCGLLDMSESALEVHKDNPFNILCEEFVSIDPNFGNEIITYGPKETPRDVLIDLSEDFLKKKYGKTILGRIAARELSRSHNNLVIFTDAGKEEDMPAIIRAVGKKNVTLVRIHRDGCDFSKDSRRYLDHSEWVWDVDNNGPLSHLTGKVARCITRAFGIEPSMEIELHDDR